MTERFLETRKMWMENKWKMQLMRDLWLIRHLSRMSRQTQYYVVLRPTIDDDTVYGFLNTHDVYTGPNRLKAWLVFNWHSWFLGPGMTIQTIVLRGWEKDD